MRWSSWAALLCAVVALLALAALIIGNLGTLATAFVAIGVAGAAAWTAATRRGAVRVLAGGTAAVALVVSVLVFFARDAADALAVFLLAAVGFAVARRPSRRSSVRGGPARASSTSRSVGEKAVLLMNPKSGGGKVERFNLVDEAKRRGVTPVLLRPGDDLRALAREAAGSADVIGMAGGDGSQALVAEVAMEYGTAYVCVPAGTRNHLALDLGLDRDDVVSALDAFHSELQYTIDLAFVNDRIFVNNVSLGVYAEIVQSDAYRDAKVDTARKMLPDLLGPDAKPFDLRFAGPDGGEQQHAQLILVSNNPYALDRLFEAGTRASLNSGKLGVVAVAIENAADAGRLVALEVLGEAARFHGWRQWSTDRFEVQSGSQVAAGIDGEAVVLEPPLRFRIAPSALCVRLPASGSRPSRAGRRTGFGESLREHWTNARSPVHSPTPARRTSNG